MKVWYGKQCRSCGGEDGHQEIQGSNAIRYKGRSYLISPCEMMQCVTCAEVYFSSGQAKECTRKLEHQHSVRMLA